jgi:glucose/arabinose dehydrogenase
VSVGVNATKGSAETLRNLPTTARPVVDSSGIEVPDGYVVEPVLAGLSFPMDLTFADDGTLFIAEGGSTWPTRPYMPERILRLRPDGRLDALTMQLQGGPRGLEWHDGDLYITVKGGYHTQVLRVNPDTGEQTVLLDRIPNGGWHEPGGPVFGQDGLMYFAQGSVALQGVVLPAGFTVDIAKHPNAQDFPGQDVTLTGNNVWSRDPRAPYPYYVETGAFKPYGAPGREGEVVNGQFWCTTGVWRSHPDGSEPEMLCWGIRNPFGMAINEQGELFISDNDFEEKGPRAIANDPDAVWRIRNATSPHGSVSTPDWYGYPDFCRDGLRVDHESHHPLRGGPAEPLLADPPPMVGAAEFPFEPHTGMAKMDFCRSDAFGHRGDLFVCLWGTLAPLNTTRPEATVNGFQVVRLDVETGEKHAFARNRQQGPASREPGSGGLERPVSCAFSPDGSSLYVLDFGRAVVNENLMVAYAHTGVLWRITAKEGA